MNSDDDAKYKEVVVNHINSLVPFFARAAIGDFSKDLVIPKDEDEFTSLDVGIQIMLDVIREKMQGLESINQEIRRQFEEKSALLQSIGDGVVVLNQDGVITFLNRSGSYLSGWGEKEILGRQWSEVMPLEVVDGTRVEAQNQTLAELLAHPTEASYYYVRKDGSRFPASTTLAPVVLDGKKTGTVIVFRDTTKDKEREQVHEEFLSLAAHQLRSPLVTMRWTLELLASKHAGELSAEVQNKIDVIHESNQHMIGLVNDILSISRIARGKVSENMRPHLLPKLMESVIKGLTPMANSRSVKLVLEGVSKELETNYFLVDDGLLSQCLENIVSNAIKYSKDDGGKVKISIRAELSEVCFTVEDQGIGIPEGDRPHIFDKFYRGQNVSLKKDVLGSGLGLFVVKSFVEKWGGKIKLESKENIGTTVTLCIPLKQVASPAEAEREK